MKAVDDAPDSSALAQATVKARRWWDVRVRRVSEWIDLTEFRTMLAAIGGEEAGFSWWIERSRGGGVADGNLDWKALGFRGFKELW